MGRPIADRSARFFAPWFSVVSTFAFHVAGKTRQVLKRSSTSAMRYGYNMAQQNALDSMSAAFTTWVRMAPEQRLWLSDVPTEAIPAANW
jgi:hypothetical protein